MRHITYPSNSEQGFTAIEMLVTIIVAALFAISFYQLFTSVNQSSALSRHRATASDIAYNNMRRFASADVKPTDWSPIFDCDETVGSGNTNDVTLNANATGTTLMSGTNLGATIGPSINLTELPAPITYSVKALAIFGCNGVNNEKPIRVESQVTYGPQNTVIKHATLVGF